jgi:hypothetical protein
MLRMLRMGKLLGFQPNATEAQLFINACAATGNPLNTTQKSAINTLVTGLKTNGLWAKMDAIYPMIGGVSATHKFNLKDPRDLDAAYRLTFIGSPTHSSTGIQWNGTSQYADTYLTPSARLTNNDTHISYYARNGNAAATMSEIGAGKASAGVTYQMLIRRSGGAYNGDAYNASTNRVTAVTAAVTGYYVDSRTTSTLHIAHRNGSLMITETNANVLSVTSIIRSMLIGCSTSSDVPAFFSDRQAAFATIGKGLTSAECATLYTLVQAYQTTLGRQV